MGHLLVSACEIKTMTYINELIQETKMASKKLVDKVNSVEKELKKAKKPVKQKGPVVVEKRFITVTDKDNNIIAELTDKGKWICSDTELTIKILIEVLGTHNLVGVNIHSTKL